MLYYVPGTHGIYVSKNCEFHYRNGEVCELPVSDGFVAIKMFGKPRRLELNWVKLLSMFGIIDDDCFDTVRFFHIPHKKNGFPWRVVFTAPKWYISKTGYDNFRIVPGYPETAVNADGLCINTTTGRELRSHLSAYGYPQVKVYNPISQHHQHITVHILVALAWVNNDSPAMNFIVNHLDTNKLNSHYKNLEWTTSKGNSIHAVAMGVTQSCVCRVRNVHTGEIMRFPSIAEMFRFLGYKDVSKEILLVTQTRMNRLYNNVYEVRIGNDPRPWFFDKPMMNIEPSRYIVTIIDNGQTLIFNGTRKIVSHYKLWNISTEINVILDTLRKRRPDIIATYVDQYDTRTIEVLNVTSNEVREFPSIRETSRILGISRTSIKLSIKHEGKKIVNGYRARYKSLNDWTNETMLSHILQNDIKVTHKKTQHIHVHSSLRAVASALNMSRAQVKRHLRSSKENDTYTMEFLQRAS